MAEDRPDGYSSTQIMLHWSVATLVVFQFFLNAGIGDAWRSLTEKGTATDEALAAASVHVTIGLTILTLASWRIFLRLSRGAPQPPSNEPALLRRVAEAAHLGLYVLIVVTPLSGAATWFLGSETAATAHGVARTLLFILAALHIAGALFQHFVFRSDVLTRMLMTKD